MLFFLGLLHFSDLTKKINGGSVTSPGGVSSKSLNPKKASIALQEHPISQVQFLIYSLPILSCISVLLEDY